MLQNRSFRIGNSITLAGSILSLFAFFTLPYINLLFFQPTAVALASASNSPISLPVLWLEVLVSLAICALAGSQALELQAPPPSDPSAFTVINRSPITTGRPLAWTILSALTLLILIYNYFSGMQQQNSLLGISPSSLLLSGYWAYLFGIVLCLVGGFIEVRHYSTH